jgi:DNA-directed RNA polymerase specialized sigma24 family protein
MRALSGNAISGTDRAEAVSELFREHALGLTRLAFLMLGDRSAAEDVVQEAFCGLCRAWDRLPSHDKVAGYLKVSVLNGCRSVMRRSRRVPAPIEVTSAASAEADALVGEERRAAVAALRRLHPPQQRFQWPSSPPPSRSDRTKGRRRVLRPAEAARRPPGICGI